MIPLSEGKTDCKDGLLSFPSQAVLSKCQTIIQQQILIQADPEQCKHSATIQETPQAVYQGAGYAAVSAWSFDWSHIRNLNSRRNTRNMKVSKFSIISDLTFLFSISKKCSKIQ